MLMGLLQTQVRPRESRGVNESHMLQVYAMILICKRVSYATL